MALRAGRVGVAPDQVNQQGKVKGTDVPIATPDKAGTVKPVAKTAGMTQDVGIDSSGKLYTTPSGTKFYMNVLGFDPTQNASQSKAGGWQFKTLSPLTVDAIKVFPRAAEMKVYVSTDADHHLYNETLTGLTVNEWNTITLQTPLVLSPNTSYTIWYTGTGSDSLIKYKSGLLTSFFVIDLLSVSNTTADTFPATSDTVSYGIDIITHLLA